MTTDATGPAPGRRTGVVVMAYGTPRSPADIEAYYTHIRRGRPPEAAQLAELTARYEAIGGVSPLAARTEAQRAAVQEALDRRAGPGSFRAVLGQKHAAPFIEDGVAELVDDGVDAIVGLVLAPHFSGFSVGQYHERARTAAGDVPYAGIESWHLEPAYLDFLADAVTRARAGLPTAHKILFTAHSLPERVLAGDPYPDQLRDSAAAVAQRVGLDPWADWSICWQSAGRTPEPWRGPDILEVIGELAATGRAEGVLVCPQGFVADHLEVLYDLDIEAAQVAAEVGLTFARTDVCNDDPAVMGALAGLVLDAAGELARPAAGGARQVSPTDARPVGDAAPRDAGVATTASGTLAAPHGAGAAGSRGGHVVVVGAGITGLTAAHALQHADPSLQITIVDAAERTGGKLHAEVFAGHRVDEGADAFLARVPAAVELCHQLGLGDRLTTPATGTAYLWARGALRRFPDGLVLGVPTDLGALAASGLLSDDGVAAARRDEELEPEHWAEGHDETVGALVRRRCGDEVFEVLVAPLLGGVNAGDADELSVRAGAPQLAQAMQSHGRLLEGLRAQREAARAADPDAPVFHGLIGGTGLLAETLTDAVVGAGAELLLGTAATGLAASWLPGRSAPVHQVRLDEPHGRAALDADAVVLAVPTYAAAPMLTAAGPAVTSELEAVRYASCVVVTLALPRDAVGRDLDGSGVLVPPGEDRLLTACSWASSKWAHLAGDGTTVVLRASAGRVGDERALAMGDDELVAALLGDLAETMEVRGEPTEVRVSRWPRALPQFRPGHLDRVRATDDALALALPGVVLAGAGRTGLGVPACITQGRAAADRVLARLATR
ncbi:MAG: protoporphyrinogen oxidase [Acidimicrobiales bacterium]